MTEEPKDLYVGLAKVAAEDVIDTYQCMSDDIRRVVVCRSVTIEFADANTPSMTQTDSGFIAVNETLIFLSKTPLANESSIEAAFVCMTRELPSKLFKDSFPSVIDPIAVAGDVWSRPSMLTNWQQGDTLPIRGDAQITDFHTDVSQAASRISKYMRVSKPLTSTVTPSDAVKPHTTQPIRVDLTRKRPRDAREFREQILSTGAQGEFFVWSHIKARYGDAADLSWWLTSTKRQFFPTDLTPIDDSIGSDFFIPKDDYCLFATKGGGPVHIEVKGTGRFGGFQENTSFEISRNELKMAEDATKRGEEYVVAVVSGLAGINRPRLETIVRDFSTLELIPTRFIATVRQGPVNPPITPSNQPSLTKSSWY